MMRIVLILACIMASSVALARITVYDLDTVEQQNTFQELVTTLRCPKCQNNNLADSQAGVSLTMKNYIYQAVKDGRSEQDITDYLVSRYGEFITYSPRAGWIWWLPTVLGFGAACMVIVVIARKQKAALQHNAEKEGQ